MRNKLLFILFSLLGMLFSSSLDAQTVRSTNITKVGGKEYYMHHVKQGETLWGLSKLYNVTIEEIEALNPEVKKGLKAGHVVGIPVRPVVGQNEEPKPQQVETTEPEPEPQHEPEPEPEPEPKPEPEPVVVEPKPVVVEPEPVVVEPEPVVVESEPVVVEPEPVVEPKPVVVEPKPNVEVRPEPRPDSDSNVHVVKQGEDLYDIAKAFGIDVSVFRAANPGLSDEPAAGTRIVIPQIANEKDYILHSCERNERVSSLVKRWKVDENEFRRMNVSLGSHVFEDQVVLIPIKPIKDFYWMLEVQEETVENEIELLEEEEEEPEQLDIPQTIGFDAFGDLPECVAKPENAIRRYKVALMVPLYLHEVGSLEISKENLPKLQKARSLSFVQFYEGFMMAVEELEEVGLRLDLTVIDVTDNVATAESALSKIRNKDLDMIVGPFFSKSFAVVEEYAKAHNIVVVNPLSTRESVVEDNPNVVKVKPGEIGQILAISSLVKNLYSDANVFIVSKERNADTTFLNQLEQHLNLAVNEEVTVSGDAFLQFARNESKRLEMGSHMVSTVDVEGQVYSTSDFRNGTTGEVVLTNSVKRYAYGDIGKVKSQLSGVRDNVIVAYGDDNVFATQMLNSLAKETDRFPITLVCAPDWDKFEKLLVDNLLLMNAIYLDDFFVDYNSDEAKRFVVRFRQKYVVEPQNYAFEGYDMAMFFLTALMRYGDDMLDCLDCCNASMLHTRYRFFNRNYLPNGMNNGRENQYWSVYQYDNESIELKPVDPFKKKAE